MRQASRSTVALAGLVVVASIVGCSADERDASSDDGRVDQQGSIDIPQFLSVEGPRPEILLLGTFHFAAPGQDWYKQQFPVDMTSGSRIREIQQVVDLLADFRPTHVAVERDVPEQSRVDSLYRAYRAGDFQLTENEVYQLGFRLARERGHQRVYAVDASGRSYFPDMTQEEYEARMDSLRAGTEPTTPLDSDSLWNSRFRRLYRFGDSLKAELTLREMLIYMNRGDRLRMGHGHYLVGWSGERGEYLQPDLSTSWWNRNLRIFHNITSLIRTGEERIVVIIGAGHVPILRHAVQSSPAVQLVEVGEVLGSDGG